MEALMLRATDLLNNPNDSMHYVQFGEQGKRVDTFPSHTPFDSIRAAFVATEFSREPSFSFCHKVFWLTVADYCAFSQQLD